jgi:predicted nucleotide-binding protein
VATVDEVRERLAAACVEVSEERRLGNDTGTQLRLRSKQTVNVYDNGTVNVQGGGDKTAVIQALGELVGAAGTLPPAASRDIFVVYGHDATARAELEAMLRRWGLNPLILDQLPSEGQTLIEKLEGYSGKVGFAVVLATPDDEGYRVGHPDERAFRARQNVVLELGMLLAKLGRARVAILMRSAEAMERPSDIQGLIYIPFTDSVEETKVPLSKEMDKQGIKIAVGKL